MGYKVKILLVGDGGVGKTSTVMRFIKARFAADYKLTVGVDILTKEVDLEGGENVVLSIFDIGGQQRFDFIRSTFYKGAAGVLVVFDLTRYGTFNPGVSKWIKEINQFVGQIPIIIIGNKKDLKDLREVAEQEVLKFAEEIGAEYLETSAKTGENVDHAFHSLARQIVKIRTSGEITSSPQKLEPVTNPPEEPAFQLTNEVKELLNKKTEMILKSTPTVDEGFRFFIMGNEELQKPFICRLFRAEGIIWPPEDVTILYNTTQYKLKIGTLEHIFRIYLLSNLKRLNENKNLFIEACKRSQGVIIFYNPADPDEFKYTVMTCHELRRMFPDLEIILTAGKEANSTQFQELNKLEEEYQINYCDDIETILPNLVINTLKRLKKIDRTKKFISDELAKMQEQILTQNVNPDAVMNQMKEFIQSMESKKASVSIPIEDKIQTGETSEINVPKEKESNGKNLVFISYSTKDSELFQISKIAKMLENYRDIDKALYWEKDCGVNIIEYMNKNLGKCKAFIIFCTQNSITSKSVEAEWMAAFQLMQNKKLTLIPAFQDPQFIPPLLLPLVRVHFDPNNLDKFVTNLYNEIKKWLQTN